MIKEIFAREILDSRGNPTVEVEITTDNRITARSSVPSGASTGEHEAIELRDQDPKRYLGKGVKKAVENIIELIAPEIRGKSVDFKQIDNILIKLDGTKNKSRLGANAILAVSLSVAKAQAQLEGKHFFEFLGTGTILPCPFMNIINGGAHAHNRLDFQEFMIVPGGFKTFSDALRAGCEVFHALKAILKSKGYSTSVGDEGGFAPDLGAHEEAIELLLDAIKKVGYSSGEISLALDVAASELYKDSKYILKKSKGPVMTSDQFISLYERLISSYPIISIEDGLAEDDWDGWINLTKALGKKIQIVGDDIFVTNPERLTRGRNLGVSNAILIKPNQVGTLSETIETIQLAKSFLYGVMASHRSGETEDTTIAHIAVAFDTGMIKTGSVSRTDRTCKYNELLRIEDYLGAKATYAGFSRLSRCA